MKALVYTQPDEIQVQERPYPQLESGEVIIKIEAVGICGSDMHAYHGHDPRRKPGLVMGHELSGIVAESFSPNYAPGQKVTVNPLITCHNCSYCFEGRDNLCANRSMIGMTRPGGYAEYMSIPAASVLPLPEAMPHETAVLVEPAATVLHALNLSMRAMHRPLPEQRVLVIGGGAIGFISVLLLHAYGVRNMEMAETNPLRRTSAAKHLPCRIFNPTTTSPTEASYHYVIDAVGRKSTRDMALAALKPGGVFMHIGLQDWGTEIDMRKLTLAELSLLGTYTYTQADLYATLNVLHEKALGTLDWVEYRPLADGPQAFKSLSRGESEAAKLVLIP